jgi:hypothetical protein
LPAQFDLDDLGSEHRSSIDEEIMTTLEVGIDDLGNDSNWRPWWRVALTTLFISKEIDCLVLEGILLVGFILVKLFAFGPLGPTAKHFSEFFEEKKMEKIRKKNVLVSEPEDESNSLFAGLFVNPDVPLNPVVLFT